MINSSPSNFSKSYFTQPNLRVFDIQLDECQFEVEKQNYIQTLENLLRIDLIGKNSIDTSILSKFLRGPFALIDKEFLTFGVNVEYPF